ncbi:MAG: ankyrin repeat domain-containing protein [Bacteroidia bacterium]|nr:ankyrin repeat domain-containing protein [Bacteroidia bacterium]
MEYSQLLKLLHDASLAELKTAKSKGLDFSIHDLSTDANLLISYSTYGYTQNYRSDEMIDFLLSCGLDINHKMNRRANGETALHKAIATKNFEIARHLLERGAKVDLQDKNGNTPLFKAVMGYRANPGALEMIRSLRDKGASWDTANFHGSSPRSVAEMIGGGIDAGHNDKSWDLRFLLAED